MWLISHQGASVHSVSLCDIQGCFSLRRKIYLEQGFRLVVVVVVFVMFIGVSTQGTRNNTNTKQDEVTSHSVNC